MKCYMYGAKWGPSAGAELVEQQIRRAHRYYNVLVEIERERRKAERECAEREDSVGIDAARETATARRKAAYATASNGLYWGSKLETGRAAQTSAETAAGDGPRFRPWTGEGSISVQLQGGLPVADLLAGIDTQARVCGAGKHRELHMRVGSAGRAPVWATIPFVYDRELPAEAAVKWVRFTRRRVGPKLWGSVQFILAEPERVRATRDGATVAVDVGWRRVDGGMRVAAWVDSAGDTGELLVPGELLSRWEKCQSLRSIRDHEFNAAREVLVDARRGHDPCWPTWFVEATEHAYAWRSTARLAALVLRWRAQRWDGDAALYERLDRWRAQDNHLNDWEAHQVTNALRSRREIYRVFAAQLAVRYATVIVERLDLRLFAKRPPAAEDDPVTRAARPRRFQAGLAELLGCLAQSTAKAGGRWLEMSSVNTTRTCAACGSLETFDAATELEHTCSVCDVRYDQDHNACRNLLRAVERGDVPSGRSRQKIAGESTIAKKRAKWLETRRARALAKRQASVVEQDGNS